MKEKLEPMKDSQHTYLKKMKNTESKLESDHTREGK